VTIAAKLRVHRGPDFALDVDIEVPSKGVTSIFGPSGCGKTTLLRAIAGLEPDCRGHVRVDDAIWQNDDTFVATHHRRVGLVFQEPSLFDHLDVAANISYGFSRVPTSERRLSLERAISLLDVGSLLDRRPAELSGGERQRVAIARALAASPRVLLMDEPLAALDLARKQEIMPYLETLHDELEMPILYVSHSPGEVGRLADHLVLLDDGRVLGLGPADQMLTRLDLPLSAGDKAAALIHTVVIGHDEEFSLTRLSFCGGEFTVSRKPLDVGTAVRVRVVARDVSLTLAHQEGTSILNIFPAKVTELRPEGDSQMMVLLSLAGAPLLSRITRKSAHLLGLKPGSEVFAQAKSVALLA